jgi:hypothetical protein
MLRNLFVVGLLCLPMKAEAIEASDIYGTWRLVSSKTRFIETGEERSTLGSKPSGYITYTPDGRMITVATSSERPNVGKATNLTDADRAKLFRTMWAYSGTFSLNGNAITHHIDSSWNEFWTGSDLTRDIEVQGDKLVFTTKPQLSPFAEGQMEVITIVWEKLK